MYPLVFGQNRGFQLTKAGVTYGQDALIDPVIADIEVTPSTITLHVGETIQLVAEAFDAAGAPMPDVEFSWASTDDSMALVDDGLVTAVGEGSVDIIASAEGVDGRATATIEAAPADRVEINNYKSAMEIGETYQFVAAVYDTNNEEIVGADIVWSSSDDDVLTVSEDGLVASVGEGDANIIATFNGLHGSVGVDSSYGLAATVAVTPSSVMMDANDLGQFSAQAFNAFGVEIPGVSFQWTSSDPTNVEVDSQGLIQSFGKTSATISASVDGATGTAQVDVEGEIADVVGAYDQILATDPTAPILLRLRSYRGQQVLFQDSACTIPVESIGDPIGGVRHPVTGEILATQTSDANRPVWGGESVGAVFDGVAAEMEMAPIPELVDFSVLCTFLTDTRKTTGLVSRNDLSDFTLMTTTAEMRVYSGGEQVTGGSYVLDQRHSLVGTYDDGTLSTFLDGDFVASRSATRSSTTNTVRIGRYAGASQLLSGSMEAAAVWARAITPSEITSISEALT